MASRSEVTNTPRYHPAKDATDATLTREWQFDFIGKPHRHRRVGEHGTATERNHLRRSATPGFDRDERRVPWQLHARRHPKPVRLVEQCSHEERDKARDERNSEPSSSYNTFDLMSGGPLDRAYVTQHSGNVRRTIIVAIVLTPIVGVLHYIRQLGGID